MKEKDILENNSERHYLIFYKWENKMQLLASGGDTLRGILDFKITHQPNLPIGKFGFESGDKSIQLEFPNAYYSQKLKKENIKNEWDSIIHFNNDFDVKDYDIEHVFIFPSTPNKNEHFKACKKCPKWINEMYFFSEMEWKKIRNKNKIVNGIR